MTRHPFSFWWRIASQRRWGLSLPARVFWSLRWFLWSTAPTWRGGKGAAR